MLTRLLNISLILLLTMAKPGYGQQLPVYSQYMLNGYLINRAVAGSDGFTSFNTTARQQWIGINDAPRTYSVSWQTRLLRRSFVIKNRPVKKNVFIPSRAGRVGLGASVFSDKNGIIERTGTQFTYAYHIFMRNTQLSFGLTGVAYQFKLNTESLYFRDPDRLGSGLESPFYVPDANFGIHLLHYNYYAGFSVNQLFQSYIKLGNNGYQSYRLFRHYYFMGGYRFVTRYDYEIEPSFLIKTNEHLDTTGLQVDLSCKVFYKEDYWFGLSLRTSKDVILFGGVRVNQLYFGYSFDYGLNNLTRLSYGSHEITVALKLGDSARRFRWLRRY